MRPYRGNLLHHALKPLVLALGLCMAATSAQAAMRIDVTTQTDVAGGGICGLRQAIVAMNTRSTSQSSCVATTISGTTDVIGFDTVVFPPGAANAITLADVLAGTLEITAADLLIDASANGNVIIERARPSSDNTNAFGILRNSSVTGSLTLDHLTIRNGRISVPTSGNYAVGGGIACACAHLTVIDSTISDNLVTATFGPSALASGYGGGLYINGGTLKLTRSVVSGNWANAAGGGIAVYAGDLVLDHATISGNRAQSANGSARGGGIYTRSGGVVAMDSVVSGNQAERYGGGLLVGGALALTASTVAGNTASDGGGMKLLGGGTLTDSTISGNTAFRGGGIYDASGYHVAMHPLNLIGSTVSGNHASSSSGPRGGGIYSRYGGLYLTNSTIASNTSDFYGGGIFVLSNSASIALTHVTVAANTAATRGGGLMIASSDAAGSVASTGTVFAPVGSSSAGGENIAVTTGSITITGAGNLAFGGGLVNVSFVNVPTTGDPLLGPLQDNGGPTFTMAPADGSVAIDGYAPAGQCAAPTDQRGVHRPQGSGCDIGAVERVLDRIFADGFDGHPVPG